MESQEKKQFVSCLEVSGQGVEADELEQLLASEVETLQKLVDVSMAERAALVANDVEQLLLISRQKESLAESMEQLERRRQTYMTRMRDDQPEEGEWAKEDWLQKEPRERAMRLASARAEMALLVRRLMEIKEGNCLLLETSLEQVQFTLQYLLEVTGASHGYAHTGLLQKPDAYAHALVDCQV